MLSTFESIKKNFKIKPAIVVIDNGIFRLHYRATTLFLLISTVLVTSRQYIGEHIHCINDKGVENNVMNTFCFFTTTFTVPKNANMTLIEKGVVPHPGVGNFIDGEDEIVHHAYYQWVPFVLFLQALCFYLPHYIWKRQEGGRLKVLVSGLQLAHFSLVNKEIKVKDSKVPATSERDEALKALKKIFFDGLHVNKSWSFWFVLCELLNLINLVLQVYFTNSFLSGDFYSLGPEVVQQGPDAVDILDIVFPKITKCTFYKYGPSGTIQAHDAMCVMALNIINEKIFVFLWFWYVILGIISVLGLAWRILTIFLHARSYEFNKRVFATSCPGKLNPWQVLTVTKECHFGDWLFLYYLSKNMDGLVFKKLFIDMAESLEERGAVEEEKKPLDVKKEPLLMMIDEEDQEKLHPKSV